MRSTISMKLIIKLLLIICAYNCACWTTTLAIELPSHQKQEIIELLFEDAKPIINFPWEELDQLQLSQRRPPPPRRSPPPPPRRSPPPPPRSSPPPPPRRSPPPPPMRSPPPPPIRSPPPPPPLAPPPAEITYPMVTFDLLFANSLTYSNFIHETREKLKSPDNLAKFGLPMIRDPDTITDFNRFLLVRLFSRFRGPREYITLALRVSDGYPVGYCSTNYTAWFFDDTTEDEKALLFQAENVKHQSLGFEGNYDSLGGRDSIALDPSSLSVSIATLYRTKSGEDMTEVKRSLLVIIQMVSEAARFQYIAGPVADTMDSFFDEYELDALARSYQDNWITLSEEVANAFEPGGTFRNPVVLKDQEGLVLKTVSSVWQILNDVSLLAFVGT